jgi:hypothetical protein
MTDDAPPASRASDNLAGLFHAGPHRHRLGLRPFDAADFFDRPDKQMLIEKRRTLLDAEPRRWMSAAPDAGSLISAAFNYLSPQLAAPLCGESELEKIGRGIAPDCVLLAQVDGIPVAKAGCVCFPSGWSFPARLGHALPAIHNVVPELNAEIGDRIRLILNRLDAGQGYIRENWGLSYSAELSQDPAAHIPAIPTEFDPQSVFLRVERQALVGLGNSRLLFLIDLHVYPLSDAARSPGFREGLAAALESMPRPLAAYKRLDQCRQTLIRWLRQ